MVSPAGLQHMRVLGWRCDNLISPRTDMKNWWLVIKKSEGICIGELQHRTSWL